ncbi:MAG TPA: hypothetical protein PK389_02150 [Gammaproteobacteria bacterium]|nr:hypothetical protein [Gammaproteobacteria bacterium]
MTDRANESVIKTQRDRRKFSLDDKRRLCKVWQASGLSKHRFCEQNDLVLSALTRWCNKFLSGNVSENANWIPVETPDKPSSNTQAIEILLPNKAIVRVSLNSSSLKTLLQELCHATTAIR